MYETAGKKMFPFYVVSLLFFATSGSKRSLHTVLHTEGNIRINENYVKIKKGNFGGMYFFFIILHKARFCFNGGALSL